MKFNIKSAMEYSSKLKNAITDVECSLRVIPTLISRYGGDEGINNIPAVQNGIYSAIISHHKSNVNDAVGLNLTDEEIKVEATADLAKLQPSTRLQLLKDLMEERANIDYNIETIKNSSTITDAFTGKEVTYDLGCQINKMYREYNSSILKPLVEMDSKLTTTYDGKLTVASSSTDKSSVTVFYPVEIKATSNIDSSEVLKEYEEINNKCIENSANLSAVEISKFFEYEPKFNLNPSIRSLIEKYKYKEI